VNTPRASQWDAFAVRMGVKPPHRSALTNDELEAVRTREAAAPSLGRFGRLLLCEIDSYLEFFAIARAA
jgi:hypothetical protein